jgi:diguanylate cyclase (GGDEF)-like protein
MSSNRYAYAALWKSAYELAAAMAFAAMVCTSLGMLVLRRIKKPLDALVAQANAITQKKFVEIEEPNVPELKQLAIAMNTVVDRLKTMFHDESVRLEALRQQVNFDALTGLANRHYFLASLNEAVHARDSTGGVLVMIRIGNLQQLNAAKGRPAVDSMIGDLGGVIQEQIANYKGALGGRMNGADFAILVPGSEHVENVAQDLMRSLTARMATLDSELAILSMGGRYFPPPMAVNRILAEVDSALAAAELDGSNSVRFVNLQANMQAPTSANEWACLIARAIERQWIKLEYFPVVSMNGVLLHMEGALRLRYTEAGDWMPAGQFFPMAERLGLSAELDMVALRLGLAALEASPNLRGLAINLSADFVRRAKFRTAVQEVLTSNKAAGRLWLEVSEAGALKNLEELRMFSELVRATGCQMGIDHFGRQFGEVKKIQSVTLDYLKVDGSFITGLATNLGNQNFLRGVCHTASAMGCMAIALGVSTTEDFQALTQLGFDGATGTAVKVT